MYIFQVYYDLISHKDYKQIKNNLSIDLQSTNVECLHQFDNIFKSIEEREFGTVEEFHQISVAAITKMQEALKDETPIDISYGYIPDISALLPLFLKVLFNLNFNIFSFTKTYLFKYKIFLHILLG